MGRDVVVHVFSVTFLIFIAYSGKRNTFVIREAFYMEKAFTLAAHLLRLCATIQLSVTQGTLKIK